MGFHPIPPCSKNCRIGKKQMVSILCAVYFEGLRQVQRLLFGANLPGRAKPDQLFVQKGFALLLLALLRRAHPIAGNVELSFAAHGAESQLARKRMLAQSLPATRAASVCRAQHRGGGTCDRGSRRPSNSAAQAILEKSVSRCRRTNTPTPPFLFIPSLELAEEKCLLRYPNDGTAEPVNSARGAESRPVS